MKHLFRIMFFILTALVLSALPMLANASGAPESQFGFTIWPYRQTACCSIGCSQCQSNRDCPRCAFCQAVTCTARPAATVPPAVPAATPRPTAQPASRPAAQPTARPTASPSSVSTGDYTTLSAATQEQNLWNLVNADRAANGLPSLPLDAELSRLARLKSQDMRDKGYFAHESPTYGNAASMLRSFGYAFQGVGENIAHHANVNKAEAAFLSSPGHRTNLMGRQWTKIGIGVCFDKNGFVYVTQLFVR